MAGIPIAPARGTNPSVKALREGAATALERAHRFVEVHGDEISRLRMDGLLQVRPTQEVVQAVAARQRADGSFAPLDASSLGAFGFETAPGGDVALLGSLDALALLSDLGGLHGRCVERLVDFVSGAQRDDGSWGSREDQTAEQRLVLSGMLAGVLGKTAVVRESVLERAGRFVGEHWSPLRVQGGRWVDLAWLAHFFTNVAHESADEALQWCGRELERGFRTRRFSALACARVLLYCKVVTLPAFRVGASELVEALVREQAPDGSFGVPTGTSDSARVAPGVDAMQALIVLCASL